MDFWLPESTLVIHSNGFLAAGIDSGFSLAAGIHPRQSTPKLLSWSGSVWDSHANVLLAIK
jgi:hypothetical protein